MGRTKGSKNKPKAVTPVKSISTRSQKSDSEAPGRVQSKRVTSDTPKAPKVAPEQNETPKNASQEPSERRLAVIDLDSGENLGRFDSALLLRDNLEDYRYSHSQIKSYNACSAQSLFRSMKAPAVPQVALERGSGVHRSLELLVKEGRDPYKTLSDEWKLRILDHYDEFSESDRAKIDKGLFEESKKMLAFFIEENREWFSRVKPDDVEVPFDIPITFEVGGVKFKRRVTGFIDLLLFNSDRTAVRIFDYKTSSRPPSDDDLERDSQFALYQMAVAQIMPGVKIDKIFWYHLQGELAFCKFRAGGFECGGDKGHKHNDKCAKHEHKSACYRFALEIPLKTDEEIQTLFNTYHGPLILSKEAGIYSKQRHDVQMCSRCQYKPTCDATKTMPLPKFIIPSSG